MKKTNKLSVLAMTVAVAMVLSFIESQIPAFVSIPGVKMGLANVAVVFAIYRLGAREAVLVSLVRIFLISLLFGSFVSLAYSVAGAVLSLAVMLLLKKLTPMSSVGVSVAGGVAHNVGQIAVACFLLDTAEIVYYLPFLVLSGTLAGVAIGIISGVLVKRISTKI